jgi:diaminohydroxyphosphoribosylaminopyrimidine deaminase/5-amino-6-(5-phosphoribosylamino)uracil reductase
MNDRAESDLFLMTLAQEASQKCDWRTHPNPKVACAIQARSGEIVVAHHVRSGAAHAEVLALEELFKMGVSPEGATLAVTLEPCAHHGKTPPCVEALLAAKVKRVLISIQDPNPLVAGKGIERLRQAGIDVDVGLNAAESERSNREWLFAQRMKRAFVRLKMVTSLDGFWTAADGNSKWISSAGARLKGHELRAQAQAIVTGRKTIEIDDPELTVRLANYTGPQPRVCVLSREKKTVDFDIHRYRVSSRASIYHPENLRLFLENLFQEDIHSVLVEAGPTLTQAFLLEANLVQEIYLTLAPQFLGGAGKRFELPFGGGHLPGLVWSLSEHERLDSGELLLKLVAKEAKL